MSAARFRFGLSHRLAMVIWLIAAVPLAGQQRWLWPLLLVPLVFLLYALRAGVDADPRGVRIHALLGTRKVAWNDVAGVRTRRGRVSLLLADGAGLGLPAVRAQDVPQLVAASGGELAGPEAEAAAQTAPPRQAAT